jgi:hypothetical protein
MLIVLFVWSVVLAIMGNSLSAYTTFLLALSQLGMDTVSKRAIRVPFPWVSTGTSTGRIRSGSQHCSLPAKAHGNALGEGGQRRKQPAVGQRNAQPLRRGPRGMGTLGLL